MPSRAPTYYHWSLDKPCTTNQVYGFDLKDTMVDVPPRKTPGPFDYTRPFSNSAFFPQITSEGNMTTKNKCSAKKASLQLRPNSELAIHPSTKTKIINRGYSVGYQPVTDRLVHQSLPAGMKLDRSTSAPANIYTYKKPRANEIFLWHTLAGSLVHVKNYPPECPQAF